MFLTSVIVPARDGPSMENVPSYISILNTEEESRAIPQVSSAKKTHQSELFIYVQVLGNSSACHGPIHTDIMSWSFHYGSDISS